MPLITVLLPVYQSNPEQLALSVASVLFAESCDLELVVGLDGAASPRLLQVLEQMISTSAKRMRMLSLPKQGLVGTLNDLIDSSDSQYIARQDADDLSLPLRFRRQQDAMDEDLSRGFCGTQICRCDDQLRPHRHQRRYPTRFRNRTPKLDATSLVISGFALQGSSRSRGLAALCGPLASGCALIQSW
jgi:glycosyltransferase involved in cell wall biosynthesis